MSIKNSVIVPQPLSVFLAQPKNLNIPQYHILILAWSALVILYGECDPPPFSVANAT
jgi:hypothetical protein